MQRLPIHTVIADIQHALQKQHDLILEAPPGAGKTTAVPLALMQQPWRMQQKILMLEPRRIAARNAALRLAHNLGEPLGQTIGLRTRTETHIGRHTCIEVVTEGVLVRMLQNDPSLEAYGLVIFDEFHERNLDSDLGLTLLLEARTLFRDEHPLKLLIMSATLNSYDLSQLLPDTPIIQSAGRAFPVDIRYGAPWCESQQLPKRVSETILQALSDETGSLLVFLPGVGEIRRVQTLLTNQLSDTTLVVPLYGDLSNEQQQIAIAPAPTGQRKVVLTTAIAETSLTIEGVRVVIDAGLSRTARYDPRTGMSRLHTQRVSKATSIQRAGRAGRTEPGCCYRLWSAEQQDQLAPYPPIEIEHADLSALLLQLYQWGCYTPNERQWLTPPSSARLARARTLLSQLDALTTTIHGDIRLSAIGEAMAQLPLHPRLARLFIMAQQEKLAASGALLACLLSERDPCAHQGAALHQRIEWLQQNPHHPASLRIIQQAQRLVAHNKHLPVITAHELAQLTATAWPDRIAKGDGTGNFQLANGRRATLPQSDPLSREPWLVVCTLGGHVDKTRDQIWIAQPITLDTIQHILAAQIQTTTSTTWDKLKGQARASEQTRLGELVLTQRPVPMTLALKQQALLEQIRHQGLSILPWCDKSNNIRQRIQFIARTDANWPDLSDHNLLATLDQWLLPFVSVPVLSDINLTEALLACLSWPQQNALATQAPETFKVPSGKRVKIDYSVHPPVLAVKLQEMFGCEETPHINQCALTLHLLSPAGRPLQVTQNLTTFWQTGYAEVRKEMRGRYPKHPWPEDPLNAIATAKTKRHLN